MPSWILLVALCAPAAVAEEITLQGRVLDEDGAVVAGAAVELRPLLTSYDAGVRELRQSAPPEAAPRFPSDEDGRFRRGVEPGGWRIRVTAPGFAPAALSRIVLDSISLEPIRLSAVGERKEASGVPCVVEVRDEEGGPVAAALVYGGPERRPLGLSDEDGRVGVEVPPDGHGKLPIVVQTADLRFARQVVGKAGTAEEPVVLTVRHGVVFRGRVTDSDGRPLAGAYVFPRETPEDAVQADKDGRFVLRSRELHARRLVLLAVARGYFSRSLWVGSTRQDSQALGFALERRRPLYGRVVDADGAPVAGAGITLAYSGWLERQETVSGPDGRFQVFAQWNTVHSLDVSRPGYVTVHRRLGIDPQKPAAIHEIVLRRSVRGFGYVLDLDERPIAGAEVLVAAAGAEAAEASRVVAGVDGRFTVDTLAPDRAVDVAARAPGFATARVRGLRAAVTEDGLDLGAVILSPGSSLRGRAVDDEGRAVAGAEVQAVPAALGRTIYPSFFGAHGFSWTSVRSGPDGRFVVVGYKAGDTVRVVARAKGYVEAKLDAVLLPAEEDVVLVLRRRARVAGRVVDSAGRGVAGAEVGILTRSMLGGLSGRTVQAGEDGRFEDASVEPGSVVLSARAAGSGSAVREIEVAPGGAVTDLRLELSAGVELSGRVVSTAGTPVAGAEVRLLLISEGRGMEGGGLLESRGLRTDGEGRFHDAGLAPGQAVLDVRREGFRNENVQFELRAGMEPMRVELHPAWEVQGRVVSPTGEGVAEAQVFLGGFGSSTSHLDGGFVFSGVPDGRYPVEVRADGWIVRQDLPEVVVDGDSVAGLLIVVEPHHVAVTGAVLGATADVQVSLVRPGAPPAGVVTPQGASMDPEGRYRLSNAPLGDWDVVAFEPSSGREARHRIHVERGDEEIFADLELAAGFALAGRVHPFEPSHRMRVQLTGVDVAVERTRALDPAGRFRFAGLPRGRYRLAVTDPVTGVQHFQEESLDGDVELDLDLAAYRLRGRVMDAAGRPLAGVSVTYEVEGNAARPHATTGADGTFELGPLGRGRYRLNVSLTGYASAHRDFEVRSEPDFMEVALEAERIIELTVRLADGSSPDRLLVAVLDAEGEVRASSVRHPEAGGRITLRGLAAGSWRLVVWNWKGGVVQVLTTAPGAASAVLPPGTRLDLRVPALAQSPALAFLTLRGADSRPRLGFEGYRPRQRWPVSFGQASVRGLPPGTWHVEVTTADAVFEGDVEAPVDGGAVELILE